MYRKPRFGILTTQHLPWEKMVERWQYIEKLGFDKVWIADHFVAYDDPKIPWFEAWTILSALATKTNKIRIGTLVTPILFRNPAILARQALTIDHISNGRLEIGLGTGLPGKYDPSYSMTGIEDRTRPERIARFREVVDIVDKLLRNEMTTYHGNYYNLKECVVQPRPIQKPRPPIIVAAHGPQMIKIAASCADIWNSSFVGPGWTLERMLENTRKLTRVLDDCCGEINRDPATIGRAVLYAPQNILENGFTSAGAFENDIGSFIKLGIDEFVFPFPDREEQLPLFESIAKGSMPKFRNA